MFGDGFAPLANQDLHGVHDQREIEILDRTRNRSEKSSMKRDTLGQLENFLQPKGKVT